MMRDDRGSVSVEAVTVYPALVAMGLLIIAGGWWADCRSTVREAAEEAARFASLSRTAPEAQAKAEAAADITLGNSNQECASSSVQVDTSGFSVPVGQAATVTVTVSCNVPTGSLGLPGLGSHTFTTTVVTDLDTWRLRR